MRAPRLLTGLVGLGLLLGLSGCGDDERQLTVLAAASLTEPFTELAEQFEAEHPGVELRISFDSSASIAAQVTAGAPADVVATADSRTMTLMKDAVETPVVFARNELTLVVPPENPAEIAELGDLQTADFVLCSPAAPCGALAADVLADAEVTRRPRSLEVDVKAVLTKVMLGEADAGLVYVSDVVAAGPRVREVPLPAGVEAATTYPIAVVSASNHEELAREWVDLVRSERGRRALDRAGFSVGQGTAG